jgi:hypothetical protein
MNLLLRAYLDVIIASRVSILSTASVTDDPERQQALTAFVVGMCINSWILRLAITHDGLQNKS